MGKDVALVVTSFDNDNFTESSISSEHTQVAPAVSVRLVKLATRSDVAIGVDFVEHIHITLGAATHSAAQCAFWDAANLQWSTAGLQQYLSDTGEVVCMTPHLTLFSAVISSFETVLKCSNARVLTAEGLANLSKGGWWYRPSALTLWAMVLTFVALLIKSMLYDAEQRRRFPWQDEMFLTVNPKYKEKSFSFSVQAKEILKTYTTLRGIAELCAEGIVAGQQKIDRRLLDLDLKSRTSLFTSTTSSHGRRRMMRYCTVPGVPGPRPWLWLWLLLSKTNDFIKMINSLSKTDDFIKNDKFI